VRKKNGGEEKFLLKERLGKEPEGATAGVFSCVTAISEKNPSQRGKDRG